MLPVVAVNRFHSDTEAELELVKQLCMEAGAYAAVTANHWAEGGKGATDLGLAVAEACAKQRALAKPTFKFLYPLELGLKAKIESICVNMYGAGAVEYSEDAEKRITSYVFCYTLVPPSFLPSFLYLCSCLSLPLSYPSIAPC